MCNLYKMKTTRAELARLSGALVGPQGNQPLPPEIYPDYPAPVIVRDQDGQPILRDMRWGMPGSAKALDEAAARRAEKLRARGQTVDLAALRRMEPDKGVTNIRNTQSPHWRRWLGPAHRCLVPFTSFSEPDQVGGSLKPVWFALDESEPLAYFAGLHTPWSCVRKIKEGWISCDLFGFLTTEANAEVARVHDKAMPVILTSEADQALWLSDAPWDAVKHLQRPLPDGALTLRPTPPAPTPTQGSLF